MAQRIKGKFIDNDAVTGEKIKLLDGEALRAMDGNNVIDLLKINGQGAVLLKGAEVGYKADVDSKASQADLDAEVSARQSDVSDLQATTQNISNALATKASSIDLNNEIANRTAEDLLMFKLDGSRAMLGDINLEQVSQGAGVPSAMQYQVRTPESPQLVTGDADYPSMSTSLRAAGDKLFYVGMPMPNTGKPTKLFVKQGSSPASVLYTLPNANNENFVGFYVSDNGLGMLLIQSIPDFNDPANSQLKFLMSGDGGVTFTEVQSPLATGRAWNIATVLFAQSKFHLSVNSNPIGSETIGPRYIYSFDPTNNATALVFDFQNLPALNPGEFIADFNIAVGLNGELFFVVSDNMAQTHRILKRTIGGSWVSIDNVHNGMMFPEISVLQWSGDLFIRIMQMPSDPMAGMQFLFKKYDGSSWIDQGAMPSGYSPNGELYQDNTGKTFLAAGTPPPTMDQVVLEITAFGSGSGASASASTYHKIVGLGDGVNPHDAVNKGQLDALSLAVTNETNRALNAEQALDGRLDILEGTDAVQGSVDQKVKAAIDGLVNGASSLYDTLKEVEDYITADGEAAAQITAQLGEHETRLDTLEGEGVGSVAYAVAQEASARETAIQGLATDLNNEISDRQAAITNVTTALNQEISDRAAGDSALDARLLPFEKRAQVLNIKVHEDSAAVFADGQPGVEDPSAYLRDGWYFTNQAAGQKINWYFFDGMNTPVNVTLGQVSAYAVVTLDSLASMPILAIYTKPTGSGDVMPGFAHSKKVFSLSSTGLMTGVKYVIYTGENPAVHPELPHVQMAVSGSSAGDQGTNEQVLTTAFNSNSSAAVGNVKFMVESLGVWSPAWKQQVDLTIKHAKASSFQAEITARAAADSALDARIDALEAKTDGPAFERESFIAAEPLTHVDLAQQVIADSLNVYVGRLALHQNVDYAVSVVDGKTRLTWIGDFAVGGLEQVQVGDKIYVNYAYLV